MTWSVERGGTQLAFVVDVFKQDSTENDTGTENHSTEVGGSPCPDRYQAVNS